MDALPIAAANDVYRLVERLKATCQQEGSRDMFKQLGDAMNLGSSALEILGAIRQVILKNQHDAERLLAENGKADIDAVIAYVDKAFGG